MTLRDEIAAYTPWNEQEACDRQEFLTWLDCGQNIYLRSCNAAHLTASAWIVSPDRKQVLLAYHNLYNSWAWLGGHADGMTDLLCVARKEVLEESGLSDITIVDDRPFSLEVLTVDGHEKRGKYVCSHLHLNVTYLFEADPQSPVFIKPDENSGVGWFPTEAVAKVVSEPWMMKRIYSKLMNKLRETGL